MRLSWISSTVQNQNYSDCSNLRYKILHSEESLKHSLIFSKHLLYLIVERWSLSIVFFSYVHISCRQATCHVIFEHVTYIGMPNTDYRFFVIFEMFFSICGEKGDFFFFFFSPQFSQTHCLSQVYRLVLWAGWFVTPLHSMFYFTSLNTDFGFWIIHFNPISFFFSRYLDVFFFFWFCFPLTFLLTQSLVSGFSSVFLVPSQCSFFFLPWPYPLALLSQ